jgi:hypothetical protein
MARIESVNLQGEVDMCLIHAMKLKRTNSKTENSSGCPGIQFYFLPLLLTLRVPKCRKSKRMHVKNTSLNSSPAASTISSAIDSSVSPPYQLYGGWCSIMDVGISYTFGLSLIADAKRYTG